jgi:hypothetical protein
LTCIVATSEGIWADRRVTGGSTRYRPTRKVVRGRGEDGDAPIVAAFCGDDADCSKAMAAVRGGETNPQALAALSDGVVVTSRGRYELSGGVAVRVPKRVPLAVGGSGYAEAQAYLYGAKRYDDQTIRAALRYVSTVRTDCGDGVDALLLQP